MKKIGVIILVFVLIAIIFFSLPLLKKSNQDKSYKNTINSQNSNIENQLQQINLNNLPKIVHYNFIDLKIINKKGKQIDAAKKIYYKFISSLVKD